MIQPAIQPILIPDENMVIVAIDSDLRDLYLVGIPEIIALGTDPEPGFLARVPRDVILQQAQARIVEVKSDDVQQYMWHETYSFNDRDLYGTQTGDKSRDTIGWYYPDHVNISDLRLPSLDSRSMGDTFFASSLLRATSTDALRYHAIRQKSLSNCEIVSREDFPPTCPGANPFVAEYYRGGVYFRVCVGGNQNQALWGLTRNTQLASEHIWMDAGFGNASNATDYSFANNGVLPRNFTMHCTANSTRGFFELKNLYNNSSGPLLERWPLPAEMSSFNDDLADEFCCGGCGPVKPKEL